MLQGVPRNFEEPMRNVAMAVVLVHETPGMTSQEFDRADALLRAQGEWEPDGRIVLVAATSDDGMIVVNVWESEEKMGAFNQVLLTVLDETCDRQIQPRLLAVHHIISR